MLTSPPKGKFDADTFDGPVTERCVEFAEYDANMYCLANILSPRSSNGEFHLELIKDAVPNCILAIATAETKPVKHQEIESIVNGIHPLDPSMEQDIILWQLIEESMVRAHSCNSVSELRKESFLDVNGWKIRLIFGLRGPQLKTSKAGRLPEQRNLCSNDQ